MRQLKTTQLWLLSIALTTLCFSVSGYSQDLAEAKQLCGNLTAANRAMAKKAGYDVDKVCSEVSTASVTKAAVPAAPKVARETVSAPIEVKTEVVKDAPAPVTVAVAVAPVAVAGVGAPAPASTLKPFGYDLFANAPTTFAPAASIPVSADYLLGPGDTLDILFYGKNNSSFSLEINREGFVDFPELGPVGLAGLNYGEAKEMLQTRIAAQIVGTKVSISMGSLRSMQIFVLGEAFKPGAYTVSSLSTITHALVSSGGVSDIGSLRKIQLKRQGKLVATLDLYDLLLAGDTSNDIRVQAADVIYIPTVGDLVSIEGQVLRPAIYELKGGESIQDLVNLSGGLGPKAFASSARILRISDTGFMTVLDVDLTKDDRAQVSLNNGDHLSIDSIVNRKESVVTLSGHVYHPGQFAWQEGMTVSDLMQQMGEMRAGLDLNYATITRQDPVTGYLSAVAVNPNNVLANIDGEADRVLHDNDVLQLFSIDGNRAAQLGGLIGALNSQYRAGELPQVATITGARLSGTFPITLDMRLSDLVAAAGGVRSDYADLDYSVLVREDIDAMGYIEVLPVNLRNILNKQGGADDYRVQPKDRLILFKFNEVRSGALDGVMDALRAQVRPGELAQVASVSGARLSGTFPITLDMRLSDLVAAAGGVRSDYADLDYSVLVREDIDAMGDIEVLPVSLGNILNKQGGADDYRVQPKDRLMIFKFDENKAATLAGVVAELRSQAKLDNTPKIVSSGGTVRFPGFYPLVTGMSVSDLIVLSGGLIESAYSQSAEIARIDLTNPDRAISSILLSSLDSASSSMLEPSDFVEFRTLPDYRETQTISLEGEFVFPGVYAFNKNETLTSVIQRAGGFTNEAFVAGSVFLRESLKLREQQEMERLSRALNDAISADRLTDVNSDIEVDESQVALQRQAVATLSSLEAVGRLVIPLADMLDFNAEDILLKSNDRLLIPKYSQEVTVIGEVQRPTSFMFNPRFSQADYLMQGGGVKDSADKRGIYIVKASGEVIMPNRGFFKFRSAQSSIGPGDTIVVPLDTDDTRIRGIPLLAEVSTIIYQLALGAAAINSFSTP